MDYAVYAQRKIIHIDCDCFYAAVEMRDQPALRDVPLAIGGAADRRGVIATCNYPARKFGVHSAMSTYRAQQACPNLVLLPPDFPRYRAASQAMRSIFADYTDRIEPLSLDEAYLDVTGLSNCQGSASRMALEIRERIAAEVGITASAGIAPNKLLAKIASDWHKPNGQFVIRPQDIDVFILSLPLKKLWGVGKVTAARLARQGAHCCADLQAWPLERLLREFGKFGSQLFEQCRGVDLRPVAADERRKSLSVENTFNHDLPDLAACYQALPALVSDWQQRMQRASGDRQHKAFVKIKFNDFSQTTVECVCPHPSIETFGLLLAEGFERGKKPVRLLGVGARFEEARVQPEQLCLWP
ncbi:DNA polymerase IV [Iodobacter sp. CM08]|uniref:DNA polymerase IV n=1 Tax=Iodobacter sp. CM08 TaxID=3085902 RepID=UPI0029825190|nr:DNA polymerase IV [Iodobacter sp. CM08]MDW5416922.1 DNA polymerase IV [Iodobacter sp. CM08]